MAFTFRIQHREVLKDNLTRLREHRRSCFEVVLCSVWRNKFGALLPVLVADQKRCTCRTGTSQCQQVCAQVGATSTVCCGNR